MKVHDFSWNKNMLVKDLVSQMGNIGFQSIEIEKAAETIVKMKKNGAKIFMTFTSNLVTSGLRGFFAQLIKLGMIDVIVTTVGSVEEDIMKALGEDFFIGDFNSDDVALYEEGVNRVGNLFIRNETYMKFEDKIMPLLKKAYNKQKRWPISELLKEIGSNLNDKNSFLMQATKKGVPVFCPGITDGSFGFHLFMFQQKHDDFIVDIVKDFKNILFSTSHDEKKGIINLGGGISKHHAIFSCLLNGGLDYAVYLTTETQFSGSMSGATTNEAKSWGKIKDDSDAATVIGDATITFPLVMVKALELLSDEGIISDKKQHLIKKNNNQ